MKTARTLRTSQRAREAFLIELAQRGNITDACRVAGIGRSTAYQLRDADPEFAAAWDEAINVACDGMEREAYRRAFEGVREPIIGRVAKDEDGQLKDDDGNPMFILKYSDSILLRYLSAHRQEKWRERQQVEHSGEMAYKVYAGFDPDKV